MAIGIFLIFALGIYGATSFVFKIIYRSRISVLETALLSEELEVVRNIPYDKIGLPGGAPDGILQPQKTINRDGVVFVVNTTVRNVDDPFDGTLGGNPNDLSFADFKLVELSVTCTSCEQQHPLILSTNIGPKGLEGSTKNGALFINVFDALGQPVVGANVHVVNTTSAKLIDDVTDQDGYLRIIDIPTGTANYYITVSKNGYSLDKSTTTSVAVPNPVKPPSNVVSQDVTNISFSIDQLSNLTFHTVSTLCAAIPNQSFNLRGRKIIGIDPTVYKYDATSTTDGSGNKSLPNMEWDTYDTTVNGGTYDIAGTIPADPFYLIPGSNQDLTVVLKAHTTNSLLVKVIDAATNLPVASSTVQLTGSGYDNTLMTGVGYMRQTDWSGGKGLATFTEGRYYDDDGNITNNNPAGDVILKKSGSLYASGGWLESGTFDFGSAVTYGSIITTPVSQPVQAGGQPLVYRIATSNSSSPTSWAYTGPDGVSTTYYTPTSTQIYSGSSGKRYLRYKAFLFTANRSYTPRLSDVAITFTNSCTPPGQAFFDSLSAQTYNLTVNVAGYQAATSSIDVAGRTDVTIYMAH